LPAAWLFIAIVSLVAMVCACIDIGTPIWPTPAPLWATTVFVIASIYFNRASAYQRFANFARVVALESPIVLALLWIIPWHFYVAAAIAVELGIFARERLLGINPTIWYIRLFNAGEIILAGAAARGVLSLFWHPTAIVQYGSTWSSPQIFLALFVSAATWKATDMLLTHVALSFANGTRIRQFGISIPQLYSESALIFSAVPLALLWSINVWLALFVLASIAGGSMLVHFSEIEHGLRIDGLTGVVNSTTFRKEVEAALAGASRARHSLALLIVDVDFFKAVNDTFGHGFGDQTLVWFANILKSSIRPDDVLGRVGGEEFAILLRDATPAGAFETAERLRESIARAPCAAPNATELRLTASIGVSMFPVDGIQSRDLFRAADAALYSAKAGGRNQVWMSAAVRLGTLPGTA
jgi:diguanylate cyclase (GGDEF)-like protein